MEECHNCGSEFSNVALHWNQSKTCDYPNISELEWEVLEGLMLGDGSYNTTNGQFWTGSIKKDYLEWLNNVLGILSNGPVLAKSSDKVRENTEKYSTVIDPSEMDISDFYQLTLKRNPKLEKFGERYIDGHKTVGENVQLTPTTLLLWYVGDGHYDVHGTSRELKIGATGPNIDRAGVEKLFGGAGLPLPNRWNDGIATWSVVASKNLFEYMADSEIYDRDNSIPGMKYKFPNEIGGTEKSMKDLESM